MVTRLNGYQATTAIRAMEGDGRHTPIIAMTAGARREDQDRCLAVGMDSYLAKPVSRDALLAMVARTIKKAREGATAQAEGRASLDAIWLAVTIAGRPKCNLS